MQPHAKPHGGDLITFTRTFNPNHLFNQTVRKDAISNLRRPGMVQAFRNKSIMLTTRHPANLRKLLIKAKFELNPTPREPRVIGLFPCGKCKFCSLGYIKFAREVIFQSKNEYIKWTYTRFFFM